MRTEPPVSVPSPATTMRAPIAAPVPDEEPPALRAAVVGIAHARLRGRSGRSGSSPRCRRPARACWSCPARWRRPREAAAPPAHRPSARMPFSAGVPAVLGSPATWVLSLTTIGTPASSATCLAALPVPRTRGGQRAGLVERHEGVQRGGGRGRAPAPPAPGPRCAACRRRPAPRWHPPPGAGRRRRPGLAPTRRRTGTGSDAFMPGSCAAEGGDHGAASAPGRPLSVVEIDDSGSERAALAASARSAAGGRCPRRAHRRRLKKGAPKTPLAMASSLACFSRAFQVGSFHTASA